MPLPRPRPTRLRALVEPSAGASAFNVSADSSRLGCIATATLGRSNPPHRGAAASQPAADAARSVGTAATLPAGRHSSRGSIPSPQAAGNPHSVAPVSLHARALPLQKPSAQLPQRHPVALASGGFVPSLFSLAWTWRSTKPSRSVLHQGKYTYNTMRRGQTSQPGRLF